MLPYFVNTVGAQYDFQSVKKAFFPFHGLILPSKACVLCKCNSILISINEMLLIGMLFECYLGKFMEVCLIFVMEMKQECDVLALKNTFWV